MDNLIAAQRIAEQRLSDNEARLNAELFENGETLIAESLRAERPALLADLTRLEAQLMAVPDADEAIIARGEKAMS